jgi:hypothetical protein
MQLVLAASLTEAYELSQSIAFNTAHAAANAVL